MEEVKVEETAEARKINLEEKPEIKQNQEKTEIVSDKELIQQRKEKFVKLIKERKELIFIILLIALVILGVVIRTSNMYGLKDVTTGQWTLGPDLDPFLFLRWAKYIVEHGSLMKIDMMRNVPLGLNTNLEMKLLSYMIAWFYKFLSFFNKEVTVEYAAVIFPVFMFALTIIAFFLLVHKIFSERFKENKIISYTIAIIATAFLIVLPSLLSRTIAGIPEKESAGFFFMFISFYLFISAWKTKKTRNAVIFGILSGVSTALMALIWGGVIFIFMTIALAVFLAFIFGKINKKRIISYLLWVLTFLVLIIPFSARYTIRGLITSTSPGAIFVVLLILIINFTLFKTKLNIKPIENFKAKYKKIPETLITLFISILLIIVLIIILFGMGFIIEQIKGILDHLIHPFGLERFMLTVAENRQPYFVDEWRGSFGPIIKNIPLFFWLFFVGSIFLFFETIKKIEKREKFLLAIAYIFFLFSLIFSRYSSQSRFNGVSGISKTVYFGGMFLLAGCFIYVYFKYLKEKKLDLFKEIDFSYLILFVLFFLAIVAARGAVRFVMVLAPVATIIIAYFSVDIVIKAKNTKDDIMKIVVWGIAIVVIISTLYTFYAYYQTTKASARGFIPSSYTIEWQKAMAWVRENTDKNAVFSHWWDYGYWIQSIGNRATVLDGGNFIVYWNHLLGRHVLTESDENKALEFLYTHNATHLLIDSTDIGKYPAYSSIGSDENYDRYSWIQPFILNEQATMETRNETVYVYQGSTVTDEDISWKDNVTGEQIFLPGERVGIIGIILRAEDNQSFKQPEAVFLYENRQIKIPLRYLYYEGKLYDFDKGLESAAYIMPRIIQEGQSVRINNFGAALYLSRRTFNSLMVRLYLLNEKNNFKLIHTQQNEIIASLKQQGLDIGDFAFFGQVLGPIKIWEINYPSNIKENPDFLITTYPNEKLRMSRGSF